MIAPVELLSGASSPLLLLASCARTTGAGASAVARQSSASASGSASVHSRSGGGMVEGRRCVCGSVSGQLLEMHKKQPSQSAGESPIRRAACDSCVAAASYGWPAQAAVTGGRPRCSSPTPAAAAHAVHTAPLHSATRHGGGDVGWMRWTRWSQVSRRLTAQRCGWLVALAVTAWCHHHAVPVCCVCHSEQCAHVVSVGWCEWRSERRAPGPRPRRVGRSRQGLATRSKARTKRSNEGSTPSTRKHDNERMVKMDPHEA